MSTLFLFSQGNLQYSSFCQEEILFEPLKKALLLHEECFFYKHKKAAFISCGLLKEMDLKGIEPSNLTDANRALSQLSYGPLFISSV